MMSRSLDIIFIAMLWIQPCACLICLCCPSGTRCLNNKAWRRDEDFDGKRIDPGNLTPYTRSLVTSAATTARCASACTQLDWCQSFFYHRRSGACHLHSQKFSITGHFTTIPAAGFKYYKRLKNECDVRKGYTLDVQSGLCYKAHTRRTDAVTARRVCQSEGACLVTLDTDLKVERLINILITSNELKNNFYHVGAARPCTEWNSAWTETSSYFLWDRTLQSTRTINHNYYIKGEPYLLPTLNCLDMGVFENLYLSYRNFTAFAFGHCSYQCYFVCEIPL